MAALDRLPTVEQIAPDRPRFDQPKAGRLRQGRQIHRPGARAPVGADHDPGSIADQLINQPRAQQAARQHTAPFAEDAGDAAIGQFGQRGNRIALQMPQRPEFGTFGRKIRNITAQNHAHGLARGGDTAHVQAGAIRAGGPCPDQNRVMLGTQCVNMGAGGLPGDPLAVTIRGGDAPIETVGQLQGDERTSARDAGQKARLQITGLGLHHAFHHLDPGVAQDRMTPTGDAAVGIGQCADNADDARLDQPLGTGRGSTVMRARFKRDIGRRTPRQIACGVQGHTLGMGAAAGLGPAAANDPTLAQQDTANGGVRPDIAQSAPRKAQRMGHVAVVVTRYGHGLFGQAVGAKFGHELVEIVGVLKVLVDAGKADIGDVVDP